MCFTQAFLDDVILGGRDLGECYRYTCAVLEKFRQRKIKVKMSKCHFFASTVEYLGHSISANGIIPLENHQQAILETCSSMFINVPQNISQISFIGISMYYQNIYHI